MSEQTQINYDELQQIVEQNKHAYSLASNRIPPDELSFNLSDVDYQVIDCQFSTEIGFSALAVENVATNEVYVVYVGTDQFVDMHENGSLALTGSGPQGLTAIEFFDTVASTHDNIHVSGHSLGANLEQIVATNSNNVDRMASLTTFNGVGVVGIAGDVVTHILQHNIW